jgi:SAM-dependent methyltransferase
MMVSDTAVQQASPEGDLASLSARDRALTARVREALHSHRQLHELPLSVIVRGGIAHVRGTTRTPAERRLLRSAVARVQGILAVWDIVNAAPGETVRIIDIGCGRVKQVREAIGIDAYPHEGVDVVADVEKGLPFSDRSIDHVFAVHVLEHIHRLISVMNEIHRVLKPDGMLHVLVPCSECVNSVADPTHVRFFNRQTFKFFCESHPGLLPFRPLSVSSDAWNVYADLSPLRPGEPPPTAEELALFFD